LKANPSHRVLILTHGTKILRSQYCEELNKIKDLNFTYQLVDSYAKMTQEQVIVAIPQTIRDKYIGKFNLIIVDEAHQFYFAEMVQAIIKDLKSPKQLLLTGTPSEFILKKYPVFAVAVN